MSANFSTHAVVSGTPFSCPTPTVGCLVMVQVTHAGKLGVVISKTGVNKTLVPFSTVPAGEFFTLPLPMQMTMTVTLATTAAVSTAEILHP